MYDAALTQSVFHPSLITHHCTLILLTINILSFTSEWVSGRKYFKEVHQIHKSCSSLTHQHTLTKHKIYLCQPYKTLHRIIINTKQSQRNEFFEILPINHPVLGPFNDLWSSFVWRTSSISFISSYLSVKGTRKNHSRQQWENNWQSRFLVFFKNRTSRWNWDIAGESRQDSRTFSTNKWSSICLKKSSRNKSRWKKVRELEVSLRSFLYITILETVKTKWWLYFRKGTNRRDHKNYLQIKAKNTWSTSEEFSCWTSTNLSKNEIVSE